MDFFTSMEKMSKKILLQIHDSFVLLMLEALVKSYPQKLQLLISNLNIQKMPTFHQKFNAILIALICSEAGLNKGYNFKIPGFRRVSIKEDLK